MSEPLLNMETLYRVRCAAPKPAQHSPVEARLLLGALEKQARPENERVGMDERPYYQVLLGDIQAHLPEALSPKRAGLLCRAMGLSMVRCQAGFLVQWTQDQFDVLSEYFHLSV